MIHENSLKRKLAAGRVTHGLWVTLESPTVTEIAVALGFDWVVIDAEHGHLDYKEIVEHLRVTRHTDTTPLVRVQEVQQVIIKLVYDSGGEGSDLPDVT